MVRTNFIRKKILIQIDLWVVNGRVKFAKLVIHQGNILTDIFRDTNKHTLIAEYMIGFNKTRELENTPGEWFLEKNNYKRH